MLPEPATVDIENRNLVLKPLRLRAAVQSRDDFAVQMSESRNHEEIRPIGEDSDDLLELRTVEFDVLARWEPVGVELSLAANFSGEPIGDDAPAKLDEPGDVLGLPSRQAGPRTDREHDRGHAKQPTPEGLASRASRGRAARSERDALTYGPAKRRYRLASVTPRVLTERVLRRGFSIRVFHGCPRAAEPLKLPREADGGRPLPGRDRPLRRRVPARLSGCGRSCQVVCPGSSALSWSRSPRWSAWLTSSARVERRSFCMMCARCVSAVRTEM
jgi:hypothetical protein